MKRAELEGMAVVYALFIMRGWDEQAVEMNHSVIAEHGESALRRIKMRAWQHVRANRGAK